MEVGKPYTSRSLTATLAIAFLTLSLTVLFIAGIFGIYFNFQTRQEIVVGEQQLIAKEAANTVAGFIRVKFSLLEAAVKIGDLASLARNDQKRILARLLGLQPAFRQVVLFDPQKQELVRISRLTRDAAGELMDRFGSDLFSEIEQGHRYIGSVYVDRATSEPLVVIACPMTDIFGDFQGTLLAEVNLKFMWDLVDRLKVGETGLAYVVDRQGNLIAFSDIARVLRGENIGHLKAVGEFISRHAPAAENGAEISSGISGTRVVGTYVPLGTPDWAVVVELPVREAYRELVRGLGISAGVVLAMAMLAGLTAVYVARRLAGPLRNQTETATRIAGGETGLQAAIEGPTEVAGLARAFNAMTGQLRRMLHQEEERTRELQREIVDRRQAEEALKESETRFREVVENIRETFWLFDWLEQKVIYVSPAYEKIWGRSTEDLYNRYADWEDSVHPDDRAYAAESFARILETGGGEPREYRIVRPDGKVRWVSDIGFAVRDQDGRVQRIAGIADDITERKRAEEELKKNQNLLDESQRIAHIGSWDMDVKTGAILWSNEAFRVFGARAQTFTPSFDGFVDRVHPGDRDMVLTHLRATQKTKQFEKFEYRTEWPDGTVRWIHATGEVFCDEAGEIVRIVGTVQDVTARKQMEEALRQSEQRYRNIFETASVALMEEDFAELRSALETLQAEGVDDLRGYLAEHPEFVVAASSQIKIKDVNDAALRLFGAQDKEELLGSLDSLFVEESFPLFQEELIAVAEGRTHFEAEVVNQTLQGARIHVLLKLTIPAKPEESSNMLVSLMDITDRKRAEDELKRYRERLEELVAERTRALEVAQEELLKRERLAVLGQLTATVSHELRNPLGVIRSSNFYLQQKVKEKDEKIIKHLNRIEEQVGLCDSIVGDLLEYTRGRHVATVEEAINPWLDQFLDQLLGSQKIKLSKNLSSGLPLVPYDQEKMRRVIVNVVDNAVQAVKAKEQEWKNKGSAYQPEFE
ncbi:MAG: PAS domain-containing protein [Desulfobacterales bacterium]|nr:MAG: PAS domain-containing protein [Desulfobacterales bacterium]